MESKYKIAYVLSDLKRVGPSNQTLNIIDNSKYKNNSIVITLFDEPKDTMIDEYIEKNINVISLKLNRTGFLLNGEKKLSNLLNKYQVKLIHSYGIKADNISQKVANKLNIIHIITLRNYPKEDILTRMNFIKGRIALFEHLRVLLNCNNVICCSKTICEKMQKDYPMQKFSYIQNGVDIKKYRNMSESEITKLKEKNDLSKYNRIFVSIGSFIKRKRIDETINIFLNLHTKNDCILLLGSGELDEEIKSKYKAENIIFLGKCNNVADYLNCADYLISSSESEGLPNAVIESIACNTPVILSDIDQHKEIFNEIGDVGIYYKLGNVEDCVEKIKKIDKEKYLYYKENCNNIHNSVFTMKNMSQKYVEYYEKVGIKDV